MRFESAFLDELTKLAEEISEKERRRLERDKLDWIKRRNESAIEAGIPVIGSITQGAVRARKGRKLRTWLGGATGGVLGGLTGAVAGGLIGGPPGIATGSMMGSGAGQSLGAYLAHGKYKENKK